MTMYSVFFFFFKAEDGIRDKLVTGVQTCALPICQVRRWLADSQPANDRGDDVLRRQRQTQAAAEHRRYEDQPVDVETVGRPARRRCDGRAGKRLDLYEHRPATFERGHYGGGNWILSPLPEQ